MNHITLDRHDESLHPLEMPVYATPQYSKSEIVDAGRVLAKTISAGDEAIAAFRVAHNWRNSYLLPMFKVRLELSGRARRLKSEAVTAARLKRMQSIRLKLKRSKLTLFELQDIGGCRAILKSTDEVQKLAKLVRETSHHQVRKEYDYIDAPKSDGYRSHHIVLKFRGAGDDHVYNSQRVEVQLRTRLQHAWATAVEAVGLVRNENLKGGQGDQKWLRFFELMSAEFALDEDCAPVPGVATSRRAIRSELRDLAHDTGALLRLENYNKAIKFTEGYGETDAQYFVIQYDGETNQVIVKPFRNYKLGSEAYIREERERFGRNTVLVQVEKVDDLRAAYPNYFLDVSLFNEKLKNILYRNKRKFYGYGHLLSDYYNALKGRRRGA